MPGRLELTAVVLTGGFLLFILALVRRRQLREKYAILWIMVGVGFIILTFARPVLDRLASWLGISYGPTALFLFSTVFLMAVVAHLSWEVSRLEEKTRRLAEEISLLRPILPSDRRKRHEHDPDVEVKSTPRSDVGLRETD